MSETDSLGSIKWEITNQDYVFKTIELGGGITMEKIILADSLPFYQQRQDKRKRDLSELQNNNTYRDLFILTQNKSNWINIDKFIQPTSTINFQLKDKTEKFSGFNIYITYQNINSFMHYSLLEDELSFYEIPLQGKVNMIVLGEFEKEVFYDKIELNEALNNTELNLNLKKISKEKLKSLFKK